MRYLSISTIKYNTWAHEESEAYMRKLWAVGFVLGLLIASNVNAGLDPITWASPLLITSDNVVGAASSLHSDTAANEQFDKYIADLVLYYGASVTVTAPDGRTIRTGTENYDGPISLDGFKKGEINEDQIEQNNFSSAMVPEGYEYVIGKYDKTDAGYILFYLGGAPTTLPISPVDIFQDRALSHWTAFNPVPEPSTIIAGALLLLPLLASNYRRFRNLL